MEENKLKLIVKFRAKPMSGESEWVYGYYRFVHIPGWLGMCDYVSHKIYDAATRIEHDIVPQTLQQLYSVGKKQIWFSTFEELEKLLL